MALWGLCCEKAWLDRGTAILRCSCTMIGRSRAPNDLPPSDNKHLSYTRSIQIRHFPTWIWLISVAALTSVLPHIVWPDYNVIRISIPLNPNKMRTGLEAKVRSQHLRIMSIHCSFPYTGTSGSCILKKNMSLTQVNHICKNISLFPKASYGTLKPYC